MVYFNIESIVLNSLILIQISSYASWIPFFIVLYIEDIEYSGLFNSSPNGLNILWWIEK